MSITLEKLSSMFHMPEKEVAVEFGMCLTSLKKIARSFGITRWPYRKLRSLKRTMQKINDDQCCLGQLASAINAPFPSLDATESKFDLHKGDSSNNVRTSHAAPMAVSRMGHANTTVNSTSVSALSLDVENFHDPILSCKVEGTSLSVENWSIHWTVQSISDHLLKPLGGTSISFSSDGAVAKLSFTTCMAALQARRVALLASRLVGEQQQQQDSESFVSSPSSSDTNSETEEATSSPASSGFEPAFQLREQSTLWAAPMAGIQAFSTVPASNGRAISNDVISPPCSYTFDLQAGFACAPWSASTVWAC